MKNSTAVNPSYIAYKVSWRVGAMEANALSSGDYFQEKDTEAVNI